MAINFPDTPSTNDTYTVGSNTWLYDGEKWILVSQSVGLTDLSDVTITTATSGQIISYNGSQWVNIENFAESTKHYVKNDSGGTLAIGTAVYTSGADGTNILVKKAQANAETTSATILGIMSQSTVSNGTGLVVTQGLVSGFDTSTATAGDPVWLSPSTAGGLAFGTANKPSAPNHLVYIGNVTRVQSQNGEIFVNISNGWELEELHNVSASSPSSGDFLKYNGSVWVNDAIDLGTDTTGNYVASLVAGSGITLSNNSGEGATPTVALTSNSLTINGTSIALGGTGTITANAATLTGTYLNSSVVGSSLTSVGTLTSLTVSGNVSVTGSVVDHALTNQQTASYTLVLTDDGKMVEMNVGTANNLTVPADNTVNFPIGTSIDLLQVGAGQTTIVATSGVTINRSTGLKLRTQWSAATLIKRAANTWVAIGDLSA